MDGKSKGNLDDGTPGVDAKYTGHHWTKSVCQNCGTINSVDGINAYSCGKDVYSLNPCDSNFFLDFDSTEYTPYSSTKHKTSLKKGKYCQFCKGTRETAAIDYENHNFDEMIDGELGNRTDLQGDIIMSSDGENITVTTAKNEDIQTNETAVEYDEGTYIGNKNSKKFHRPDCHTLPAEKNRVELFSREEAINSGYSPCGNCIVK